MIILTLSLLNVIWLAAAIYYSCERRRWVGEYKHYHNGCFYWKDKYNTMLRLYTEKERDYTNYQNQVRQGLEVLQGNLTIREYETPCVGKIERK